MNKDFDSWNTFKKELNQANPPTMFAEREVWWCSVGLNVGSETDGKNRFYNRPVLVIRKFNKFVFYGVPLSTQLKENNKFHFSVEFKDKKIAVLISQMRLFDSKRLTDRLGKFSHSKFNAVREAIKSLI
jgi:mRNA interferase MazF